MNPLGLLLGGSLFITVALLAILCSVALKQTLPDQQVRSVKMRAVEAGFSKSPELVYHACSWPRRPH